VAKISHLTGSFVERGKQKADSATAPAKENKKDPKNVVLPPITQCVQML
jgi:hypothetical protein